MLADRKLIQYLGIVVLLGMGFQTVFYFNHDSTWLLVAMWAPTLAVLTLGKTGLEVLRELKKFPLRWVALALLLALVPFALNQIFYAVFNLGSWNPHFILSPDGSRTISIEKASLVLGTEKQSYLFFALNLALSVLAGSIMTTLVGALGEEIGWRGFLQLRLQKYFNVISATSILAVIWAYWHIPANLGGNNGGDHLALVTFIIFPLGVFFMSFALAWLRIRSAAIWPCAFFHGVNNTVGSVYLLKPHSDLIENLIGLLSYAIVGSVFIYLLYRMQNSSIRHVTNAQGV
ncbi:MAG: CPBP family intramembrane metalloprotease [Proteobacteria bacterium]|nr:MAG: CPBP family intramembrane metalloprotease [Pseudomonadota bacterium]